MHGAELDEKEQQNSHNRLNEATRTWGFGMLFSLLYEY